MRTLGAVVLFALAAAGAVAQAHPAGAWYRGDLHAHSTWSDGDSSVAEVLAIAEMRGLDFFALTDHDQNMGGEPRHWSDPAYRSDRMMLLYGIEWTSAKGHANIWSARPFAYERLWIANRALDAESALRAAHEEGAIFSINHPRADSCCPWLLSTEDVDAIEIWNAPFRYPNLNHKAVKEFYEPLLAEGRRISVVGGSDSHSLKGFEARVNQPGSPTTWVFAAARTPEAIIEGIRAGHVSVSYSSTSDRADLTADADGDGVFELMAGDVAAAGLPLALRVERRGANRLEEGSLRQHGATCLIWKDGRVVKRAVLRRAGDSVTFTDTPSAGSHYRAELRGTDRLGLLQSLIFGNTMALTNPIYVR